MTHAVLHRPFAALLLGAALAHSAVAAMPLPVRLASVRADNSAVHPSFTVRVVGKGRPVLLIPGLTCPGAVWDETVAYYQGRYQCHVVSLAGFGGVPAASGQRGAGRGLRGGDRGGVGAGTAGPGGGQGERTRRLVRTTEAVSKGSGIAAATLKAATGPRAIEKSACVAATRAV